MPLGDWSTPFPGNMALGAIGSPDLTREVGYALGRELMAVGINVDYAPVCDVSSNPLFGAAPARGRLPVAIAGLYPVAHHMAKPLNAVAP